MFQTQLDDEVEINKQCYLKTLANISNAAPKSDARNNAAIVIQRHIRKVWWTFPAYNPRVDAETKKKVHSIVAQWNQDTVTHITAVRKLLRLLVCLRVRK